MKIPQWDDDTPQPIRDHFQLVPAENEHGFKIVCACGAEYGPQAGTVMLLRHFAEKEKSLPYIPSAGSFTKAGKRFL